MHRPYKVLTRPARGLLPPRAWAVICFILDCSRLGLDHDLGGISLLSEAGRRSPPAHEERQENRGSLRAGL